MATWLDVAKELARRIAPTARVVPVEMSSVSFTATRPRFCALANTKLTALGITMPPWEDAVARYARDRLAMR